MNDSEFCCVVSVRIQFFFCLTNDPILLFLFGIAKEKKTVTVFFYFCNTFVTFFRFCSGLDYKQNYFSFIFVLFLFSVFLLGIAKEKKKLLVTIFRFCSGLDYKQNCFSFIFVLFSFLYF